MWKRKVLKKSSRKSLRANYGKTIAVCFIIACLTSAYAGSLALLEKYDSDNVRTENVLNVMGEGNVNNYVDDMYGKFVMDHPDLSDKELSSIYVVDSFVAGIIGNNSAAASIVKITNNFLSGKKFSVIIFLLILGFIIKLLYTIFIGAALQQGEKRFFLENRAYNNSKISKVFYLFRLRYVKHTAFVLVKRYILNFLWWFTIIGGPIKAYEYKMIPYILAENPKATSKEAFALSKAMMKGNKWRAFVLDLTFIGWDFLSSLTFGILALLYVNPYRTGTNAELYMALRKDAMKSNIDNKDVFNDDLLDPEPDFIAANEGVYPNELFKIPQRPRTPINANRKYTISSLILLFFIFSFVGWCYEVSIHLVQDGVFVNRGTMFGPWLPIYGSGGVLVVIFMRKWMDRPIFTFFLTMVICSVVEYFTSWYLEYTRGIRWWDYSGYFMNLNGRICLLGATVFGIGGCAFLYYIAPRLDDLLLKIPKGPKIAICCILVALFGGDAVYSHFHPNEGAGITDYGYLDENKKYIYTAKTSNIKRLKG